MKKKILSLIIISLLLLFTSTVKAESSNIVFLGDSITYYYDLNSYFDNAGYINSGINGNTTTDILNNMQKRVYNHNPSKVFLLIGTNDIYKGKTEDQIVSNIEEIVNKIKEHNPNCEIYLESIYPVNRLVTNSKAGNRTNSAIQSINSRIKNIENVTYVNVYNKLIDSAGNLKASYTKDGLHLSANGYDVVTNIIKNILVEESNVRLSYSSKTSNWSPEVIAGFTGSTGEGSKLKAFKLNLKIDGNDSNNQISYSIYQNDKWSSYVNGGVAVGESVNKQLEGLRIKLVGAIANEYDVYYRTHVSNIGWLDWAKNGEISGAIGYNFGIEAIEVKLVSKNNTFNGKQTNINRIAPNIITYQAHVQNIGWQALVANGSVAGTTGKSLRMEALKIALKNYLDITGNIEYTSYSKTNGWQNYQSNGNITGTTGKGLAMEAIKVRLTGEIAGKYDIYYRTHVSNVGWLDWAKNDQVSGTIGYGYKIEAVQIMLVEKTKPAPGASYRINVIKNESILYQTHVSNVGWQKVVENGITAGLANKGQQIEAFKIALGDYHFIGGGVEYSSYVEDSGWQNYVTDTVTSGTTGKGKRIEAIKVRLTGNVANEYDIYYRVYVPVKGWLGWAKNDEIAGTKNYQYRIEAIEVKLVEKNTGIETGNSYIETDTSIAYRNSSKKGWSLDSYDSNMTGTTGKGIALNGLRISLASNYSGSIQYQGHIAYKGWTSWINNKTNLGSSSGTQLEAIKIKLTGEVAEHYDIYYRSHSQNFGWLGWAKNGAESGTEGYAYRIEAIQIVLVEKDGPAPGSTTNPYHYSGFYKGSDGYTHYRKRNGKDADDWITINGVKYFFNSLGQQIGKNVKKVIDVSAHNGVIDWDKVKKTDVDGVIVKIAAGSGGIDSQLEYNVKAMNRLKIPYGAYLYSYAENQNGNVTDLGKAHEAALEAKRIVKSIKDYDMKLKLPIYYDLEHWDYSTKNHNWTTANYDPIISAFNREMVANGYSNWKIYTNKSLAETSLSKWKTRIDWVAQLNHRCTYNGSYSGWQYSFTERINGIPKNTDASVWFKNF